VSVPEVAVEVSPTDLMTINAARELRDEQVCLVGVGPPNAAANLARRLHAPGCVLVYESGAIGAQPLRLPLSIGDDDLAETALELVSVPEMFNFWIGGGRIDVGFLGAAQIDPHANLNTTAIGGYEHPKVRLPGAGGAPEIAASVRSVIVIVRHSPRTFVERLDFVTSLAHQRGHTVVITDLGVLRPDEDGELRLVAVHPGVDHEQVQEATGWDLRVADPLDHTEPVTQHELDELIALRASAGR
jgi:glutaconate CoA-transferase subunit B